MLFNPAHINKIMTVKNALESFMKELMQSEIFGESSLKLYIFWPEIMKQITKECGGGPYGQWEV